MRPATSTHSFVFIFYFLLSAIIIIFDLQGALNIVHKGTQLVTTPIRHRAYKAKLTVLAPLQALTFKIDLAEKVKILETENATLKSTIASLQSVEEQNVRMRRLLAADLPQSWHFAPARVVEVAQDTIYLTSDHDPAPNTAVITAEENGILLGIFKSASGGFSKKVGRQKIAKKPSSKDSKIPVIVRSEKTGERRASGIVLGKGGKIILDQVLTNETLEEGNMVLTSGAGGLPPELLIGYVSKIINAEGQAWKKAEVVTATNLDNLDYVFFVTKF